MPHPRKRAAGGAVAVVVTAALAASATPPAEAAARPKLSVSATKARVGAAVYATASISPVVPGGRVELQRKVGDTWVPIDKVNQRYKKSVRIVVPTVPGRHVFRLATTSGTTRTFTLRVPSDPGTVLATREFAGEYRPVDHDTSATGRYTADVEPSQEDLISDLAVFDRVTGQRRYYPLSGYISKVDISADGSRIAVVEDGKTTLIDRVTGAETAAPGDRTASYPPGSTDTVAETDSNPSLSADGRFVTFGRSTSDLAVPYPNQVRRQAVVVWDTADNSVRELPGTVVVDPAPSQQPVEYYAPVISADGGTVVVNRSAGPALVWDRASNGTAPAPAGLAHVVDTALNGRFLVGGLTAGPFGDPRTNRLLVDRATGTAKQIRLTGAYRSWKVVTITDITENGRFLTVSASRKGRVSVFRYDRVTKKTLRASVSYKGAALNRSADYGVTSESGRIVTFRSRASNVTPMQRKQKYHAGDVYVRFTR